MPNEKKAAIRAGDSVVPFSRYAEFLLASRRRCLAFLGDSSIAGMVF